MDTLLTVQQLSVLLNIKSSTLYNWAGRGKIPHLRIYKTLRFKKQDIEEWLLSFEQPNQTNCFSTTQPREVPDYTAQVIAKIRNKPYNFRHGKPDHGNKKEDDHGL